MVTVVQASDRYDSELALKLGERNFLLLARVKRESWAWDGTRKGKRKRLRQGTSQKGFWGWGNPPCHQRGASVGPSVMPTAIPKKRKQGEGAFKKASQPPGKSLRKRKKIQEKCISTTQSLKNRKDASGERGGGGQRKGLQWGEGSGISTTHNAVQNKKQKS